LVYDDAAAQAVWGEGVVSVLEAVYAFPGVLWAVLDVLVALDVLVVLEEVCAHAHRGVLQEVLELGVDPVLPELQAVCLVGDLAVESVALLPYHPPKSFLLQRFVLSAARQMWLVHLLK